MTAAPLKQTKAPTLYALYEGSPRLHDRGPIEAAETRASGNPLPAPLRGYMTAAPLKRAPESGFRSTTLPLRGYMTAAPLKPHHVEARRELRLLSAVT